MDSLVTLVVTWNPELKSFDKAFSSYSFKSRVIIVDNGSNDEVAEYLKGKRSASVDVLMLGENKGIAYALNRGVEYSEKYSPQSLIFLDQDSIVDANCFDHLVEARDKYSGEEKDRIVFGALPVGIDNEIPIGMYSDIDLNSEKIELKSIYTSGMLVPMRLAVAAPQNDLFFIDYVDTEWCYRVRAEFSAQIFLVKNALIFHQVGDSSIEMSFFRSRPLLVHSPLRGYYQIRNSIWMAFMKHVPFIEGFTMVFRCFCRIIFLSLFSYSRLSRFSYLMKGAVDGVFKRS